MANSVDPDKTAPIGAACSGSSLFASILNSSVMLGNYLQQTTFSDAFFLGPLRVNAFHAYQVPSFCLLRSGYLIICFVHVSGCVDV